MKVEVKKIDNLQRELKFEISKERVSKTFDEVYKDLGKVAKAKGFRKGKVPRKILESQHAHIAHEEVSKKLIPEVYQEGINQEDITPIDMPEIHDVSFKDGGMTFTAKLDLKPEVNVKNYKEIKVKRKSGQATEEEINKTLEYFKTSQGADKDVTIDDAFARGLGYPNLKEFKNSLSRQIEMDKDRQNKMDVEQQIVEALLKKTKLDAPKSLVRKQLEHRVSHGMERLKSQNFSVEELKKQEDEMRKNLKNVVEKDVKAYLIFDKIAQLESIEIKEGENSPAKVMEFLLKEAKWEGAK